MSRKDLQTVMDIYFNPTPAYTVRTEIYNNVPYLVVPVVMMVEGVHSGSHGPVLHLADELGRIPGSWNGIPVTIGHPRVNNAYVSANDPIVLTGWAVGTVFNTRIQDNKLQAEAWIEQSRLQSLSAETLSRINSGEVMEVSVGVFSDEEIVEGIYNNEPYTAIARNHRPDHLALLPGEVGACSIMDGCGLRVNKKGGTEMPKEVLVVNDENQLLILKELTRKGFSINQTGFTELASKAQHLLDGVDNETRTYFLEELFETYLVFKVFVRQDDVRITKFFQQNYQETADGNMELTGEPTQVKREVNYTAIPQTNKKSARQDFKTNKKEITVMAEKCTECVKLAVNNLITNKATAYGEGNREWLETLSEEQLELMNPQPVKEPQVNKEPVKMSKVEILETLGLKTAEDFLAIMPDALREQMNAGLSLQANQKAVAVAAIIANTEDGVWTEDELNVKSLVELTKVYKSCNVKKEATTTVDYSGFGAGIEVNVGEELPEALLPMGFEPIKN